MTRYVVKRGVCYLNDKGANWFDRKHAVFFSDYWAAKNWALVNRGDCRVVRLVPKGTKAARVAAREKRLGIEPLGVATCDECPSLAYTRWYYSTTPGREKVAYTLCSTHNDEMIAENKATRKRLGLS